MVAEIWASVILSFVDQLMAFTHVDSYDGGGRWGTATPVANGDALDASVILGGVMGRVGDGDLGGGGVGGCVFPVAFNFSCSWIFRARK